MSAATVARPYPVKRADFKASTLAARFLETAIGWRRQAERLEVVFGRPMPEHERQFRYAMRVAAKAAVREARTVAFLGRAHG